MKIYIKNLNKFIEAKEGTLLTDAIRQNNLPIKMPCNGIGICGGCSLNIRPLGNKYNYKSVLSCFHHLDRDLEIEFLPIEEETTSKSKPVRFYISIIIDIQPTSINIYFVDNNENFVFSSKSVSISYKDIVGNLYKNSSYDEFLSTIKKSLYDKISDIILNTLIKDSLSNVARLIVYSDILYSYILYNVNPSKILDYTVFPDNLNGELVDSIFSSLPLPVSTELIILPNLSYKTGSNIVSSIYSLNFHKVNDIEILVYLNTNPEVILNNHGDMSIVSTNINPFEEQMDIEYLSAPVDGTINGFEIEDGKLKLNILKENSSFNCKINLSKDFCHDIVFDVSESRNVKISSISFYALIDIISEFIENDIILESGKFNENMSEIFKPFFKENKFFFTSKVFITEKDIVNFKSISSNISRKIDLLLQTFNLYREDINRLTVLGLFSGKPDMNNIISSGLFEKEYAHKLNFKENMSEDNLENLYTKNMDLNEINTILKKINVLKLI